MMNKIVTTVGRYAVKKIGNKSLENAWEDYGNFRRKIFNNVTGIKSLNVGEDEEMACYRQYPHDVVRCRGIGNRVREEYHRTGKYNPYGKNNMRR